MPLNQLGAYGPLMTGITIPAGTGTTVINVPLNNSLLWSASGDGLVLQDNPLTLLNLSGNTVSIFPNADISENFNLVLPGTTGISGQVLATNGTGNLSWVSPSSGPMGATGATGATGANGTVSDFVYNYYVSVCGSDITGTGQIGNPWLTISKAIVSTSAIPDGVPVNINLAPGVYSEPSNTITRNGTFVYGNSSLPNSINISGAITFNIVSTLSQQGCGIGGLTLNNVEFTGTAGALGTAFIMSSCLIAPKNSVQAVKAYQPTANNVELYKLSAHEVGIYPYGQEGVYVSNVVFEATTTTIQSFLSLTSSIQTAGAATLNMYGCTVEQTISGAFPLAALVNISGSSGAYNYINDCVLRYRSTLSTQGSNKCCIQFNNSGSSYMNLTNTVLYCEGATQTNGIAGRFTCIQDRHAGATVPIIFHGNNTAGTTAFYYPSTATFTQLQPAQPTTGTILQNAFQATGNVSGLTFNGVSIKDGNAGTTLGIGISAGATLQGSNAIAIGFQAGLSSEQAGAIAIGLNAGLSNLCPNAIAIGVSAASFQTVAAQSNRIAIGTNAGYSNQLSNAIAVGLNAGNISQGSNSVAFGVSAGLFNQQSNSVAVGLNAGVSNLCPNSIAIGFGAAFNGSTGVAQPDRIAIGTNAGNLNQLSGAIAIGSNAGNVSQGIQAVAIGWGAGVTNQGNNAIAIGTSAGATNQPSNSIVLNASTAALNATFSGATYINPIRNNTGITSYSLLAYSTSLEVFAVSNTLPAASFGNVLRVDQVYGNDTLGAVGTYPYATLSKALSVATNGQLVQIMPGTYTQASNLTVSSGVAIRGAGTQSVVIQRLNATTSVTMFTLGSNCRIEDVTLTLTSSTAVTAGAVYTAVNVDDGNIPSAKLRTMVINVTNNNPSGSCVGLLTTGNSTTPANVTSADTVRGSTINVNASGQQGGYAQCIRVAGSNRTSARDTNLFVTGTNCTGSKLIGCETVSAGYLDLRASVISASGDATSITNCSLAEISQTNASSEIMLSYTRLQNHNANGLGFTPAQIPTNIVFGIFDTNSWTSTDFFKSYHLLPGTMVRSTSISNSANAAPFIIEQDCILRGVYLSANASLGASVMTLNVYHMTTASTPVFSISLTGSSTNTSNNLNSYTFHNGDLMYVSLSGDDTTPNTTLRSFQVNVGLF